jgi:hypothetical protein
MKIRSVLISLALVAVFLNVATSCPVCYGDVDPHTATAVNYAIFAMLMVTGTVLSLFASFFVYLRKRLRSSATDNPNEIQ